MVRVIEIPEPLLEAEVSSTWDRDSDEDRFHCTVRISGRYVVFERTYSAEAMSKDEEDVKDEFLAEFAAKFKALLGTA